VKLKDGDTWNSDLDAKVSSGRKLQRKKAEMTRDAKQRRIRC